jgi:predicted acyltransferase
MQSTNNSNSKATLKRILSLDQFRGFAIFGMILVNYLGQFDLIPETFKHPRFGMTFANTIAPYFIFAVGMGFRMSMGRRISKFGKAKAYWQAAKRYLLLIFIGILVYGPDPKCDMWDALVDIGFGGLLVLPFIMSSKLVRFIVAMVYLIGHQLIFAFTSYGEWTMQNSIDGGPLGIFPWAAILVFGTITYDYLKEYPQKKFIRSSILLGVALTIVGNVLNLLEPQALWQFSQRSMTIAYPLLSSGISVLTFVAFYYVNDILKIEIPHLTTLGYNALSIYIFQQVLNDYYGSLLPEKSPIWIALLGFIIFYALCYMIARYLKKNEYFIKI